MTTNEERFLLSKTGTVLNQWLRAGAGAAAAYYVLSSVYVVLNRISYPFELEWIEGTSFVQVHRVLTGQSLYVSPTLEFVPMVYPPLYYYLSAFLAWIFGLDFLALRILSLLSTLACAILIFLIVRKESRGLYFPFLAVGFFTATFKIGGAWFDIARVDMLFVFWLLLGLFLIQRDSLLSCIGAGIAFALGLLTKQTTVFLIFPMVLYLAFYRIRFALAMVGAIFLLAGTVMLLLNFASQGWFFFYVFDLPRLHGISPFLRLFYTFWIRDLLKVIPVVCMLSVLLVLFHRKFFAKSTKFYYYALLAAGMLVIGWTGRLNLGGYYNVLIPSYAAMAILFGISLYHLSKYCSGMGGLPGAILTGILYASVLFQFASLHYAVEPLIPSQKDRYSGEQLVKRIRNLNGEIFIPFHGYLALKAGKKSYAHQCAIGEFKGDFGAEHPEMWNRLLLEIRQALQEKRFAAILLEEEWLKDEIELYYNRGGPVFPVEDVFWPVTGLKIRPEVVYWPKR